MNKLIILGAGDLGREILYAAKENKAEKSNISHKTIAYIDDDLNKIGKTFEDINIIKFDDVLKLKHDDLSFICGIGNPIDRQNMINKLYAVLPQAKFINIIHDSVIIMPNFKIGVGNFIAPNTTIAIGTTLTDHTVINQNVSIGHDCIVGSYSIVSPGCVLSGYKYAQHLLITFEKIVIIDFPDSIYLSL